MTCNFIFTQKTTILHSKEGKILKTYIVGNTDNKSSVEKIFKIKSRVNR